MSASDGKERAFRAIAMARRVALITGGSSGIGAACVDLLHAADWNVSVVALPDANLARVGRTGAIVNAGDITRADVRQRAMERTLDRFSRLDLLINSAGVGLYAAPTQIPLEMFSRMLEVNVLAPLALAQLAIPIMRKRGGGTIVNISSIAGSVSLPWAAGYCASKFALTSVHDSLRRELRGDCIHLIKVLPGIVDTQFRNNVLSGAPPPGVERIRRIVSPQTVARRILTAVERRQSTVYAPRIGALFALADAFAPWLMDWYLSRYIRLSPDGPGKMVQNVEAFEGEKAAANLNE